MNFRTTGNVQQPVDDNALEQIAASQDVTPADYPALYASVSDVEDTCEHPIDTQPDVVTPRPVTVSAKRIRQTVPQNDNVTISQSLMLLRMLLRTEACRKNKVKTSCLEEVLGNPWRA